MKATEKYLLGDFDREQREAFEAHFFECTECAQDVRMTAALLDNARSVLRQSPVPARQLKPARQSTGWLGWAWLRPAWGIAAAAMVLVVIGYQNFVTIPHLKTEIATVTAPQALTSFSFTSAGTRGGGAPRFVIPANKPFSFYVDIPASDSFAYYSAAVETESGERKFAVPVSSEQAKDPVQILLSASALPAGNYVLVIRGVAQPATQAGGQGRELARYPFAVQHQQ
ncbi:MAG TPA: hypothetical protein VKW78_17110 [Terriglobales bacterium]|nr:hypothetical protein [Terriglobales bacterium]